MIHTFGWEIHLKYLGGRQRIQKSANASSHLFLWRGSSFRSQFLKLRETLVQQKMTPNRNLIYNFRSRCMQFMITTEPIMHSSPHKCWSTAEIHNHKIIAENYMDPPPSSSVSQTDWASFTDPLWLDLQSQASPAWGSAPVHVQLFPPHLPPVTGGRKEKKKPVSRQESIDSAEGRKSGGGETGEAVNGRVSWWRGRAVQAWDLPVWSFYLHNSISLNHLRFFFHLDFYHRSADISFFCHSSIYSAACVLPSASPPTSRHICVPGILFPEIQTQHSCDWEMEKSSMTSQQPEFQHFFAT